MTEINTDGFEKQYFSKLLLFGEYVVIRGAKALAIPYQSFSGHWAITDQPNSSNATLSKLVEFLSKDQRVLQFIDCKRFKEEVAAGLFFDSSIPEGYGAGSSGALCAAVYDRFVLGERETDFGKLQENFKLLESWFHGKGSGLDPLVCYLNRPILTSGGEFSEGLLPEFESTDGAFFLLDTGIPRQTAPLVKIFNEKCSNQNYLNKIDNELVIANNNCIQGYLNNNKEGLIEHWSQISNFQYHYFKEMIPPSLQEKWFEGILNGIYSLKLCGAGGGGFILGITKNYNLTKSVFNNWKLTILHEI